MIYSNPRLEAVIENWPIGATRTKAIFTIDKNPKRGERAMRVTIDPKTGKPNAPKILTFARQARIVDGDDGRTCVAEQNGSHITIMRGDMKYQEETIFPDNPRYPSVLALFT